MQNHSNSKRFMQNVSETCHHSGPEFVACSKIAQSTQHIDGGITIRQYSSHTCQQNTLYRVTDPYSGPVKPVVRDYLNETVSKF